MIEAMKNIPDTVAGFRAAGEVTKDDFEQVVIPVVNEVIKRTGELNYIMLIDTPLKNFTAGAWWQDMLLGIKKLTKWRKIAIVTESGAVNKFTGLFSIVAPGEYKGFKREELNEAISWVAS